MLCFLESAQCFVQNAHFRSSKKYIKLQRLRINTYKSCFTYSWRKLRSVWYTKVCGLHNLILGEKFLYTKMYN
jgi:hypothetical protein